MADNLPDPKSRKESYLAKAAGMDVEIPEKPESREEQYLNAIAEGGGGGGTSDFNELSNRPKYNGSAMTGDTNIPVAPSVVQTTGTGQTDVMSQKASSEILYGEGVPLKTIAIVNTVDGKISPSSGQYNRVGEYSILLSTSWTYAARRNNVLIGSGSGGLLGPSSAAIGNTLDYVVALGWNANTDYSGSVSLGAFSITRAIGDVNIGSSNASYGYNNTNYRILSGVHDPVDAHDAATKGYVDGLVGDVAAALNIINNGTGA